MLINILIRTCYRPELFLRCLRSIESQTHQSIRIIVSYDDERALEYIPSHIEYFKVERNGFHFGYDAYCNDLKARVNSGYFLFIDDDEILASDNVLERLCKHLKGQYGVVVQFDRQGALKPSNQLISRRRIVRGKIGMPCLVLHHSYKGLVDFDASVPASDYHWIKAVSKKLPLKFIPLVVAKADRRSNGVTEV